MPFLSNVLDFGRIMKHFNLCLHFHIFVGSTITSKDDGSFNQHWVKRWEVQHWDQYGFQQFVCRFSRWMPLSRFLLKWQQSRVIKKTEDSTSKNADLIGFNLKTARNSGYQKMEFTSTGYLIDNHEGFPTTILGCSTSFANKHWSFVTALELQNSTILLPFTSANADVRVGAAAANLFVEQIVADRTAYLRLQRTQCKWWSSYLQIGTQVDTPQVAVVVHQTFSCFTKQVRSHVNGSKLNLKQQLEFKGVSTIQVPFKYHSKAIFNPSTKISICLAADHNPV